IFIFLNAVNFGYFFIVAVNLASSSRSGAIYSILGASTPAGDASGLPDAGPASTATTVAALVYADLYRSLPSSVNADVQVCSEKLGTNVSSGTVRSNCLTCTDSSTCTGGAAMTTGATVPPTDPQSPDFVLHYVVVTYNFTALVPGRLFNLPLFATSLCN